MEFRTSIPIPGREPKIDHNSPVFLVGSCFVENIGKKLSYFKFRSLQNPVGILFHPAAIASFLERVNEQRRFTEADIFFHNERWHSYEAHSTMSHQDKKELLRNLNTGIEDTRRFLQQASHVIITLGTAWAYRLKSGGQTVANCHKVPQREFEKELMEVTDQVKECVNLLREIGPGSNIIFTVSPVRHLKDGFVENQQSKARLITAAHKAAEVHENVQYFPSYEIMMDELRDYRFYAEDMVHPSQVAIDYIWQRFTDTYMTKTTLDLMEEVAQIQRGLAHRPFNERSEAHRRFLEKLQQQIEELQHRFPGINF